MKLTHVNPSSVQKGIDLLDSKLPDWYERIDLDQLDMANINQCILGQIGQLFPVLGDYMLSGLEYLGIRKLSYSLSAYGFDVSHEAYSTNPEQAYGELLRYWIEVINERRNNR